MDPAAIITALGVAVAAVITAVFAGFLKIMARDRQRITELESQITKIQTSHLDCLNTAARQQREIDDLREQVARLLARDARK